MIRFQVSKIAAIAGLVLGVIVALTPYLLVPVCSDLITISAEKMVLMKCNLTGQIEVVLGIAAMFASFLIFFTRRTVAKTILNVMLGLLGLLILIMPTKLGMGVCSDPQMPCVITAKILTLEGLGLVVTSIAAISSAISSIKNVHSKVGSA